MSRFIEINGRRIGHGYPTCITAEISANHLREHVVENGVPTDIVCLAMLRREWESPGSDIESRLHKTGLLFPAEVIL
jgi:hypothetical protein